MSKVETKIRFGDKDYATVPDRLKEFRQKNPRADVITEPIFQADGSLIFKATIISDRSDDNSARATGHARYESKELAKPKAFEKLETVSTGRALAMLGYLNDGQIATSEEMLEFEEYKIGQAIEQVKKATKRDEFEKIIASLSPEQQRELAPHISQRTKELRDATANQ